MTPKYGMSSLFTGGVPRRPHAHRRERKKLGIAPATNATALANAGIAPHHSSPISVT